jgi:MOSC domain-containing protein
MERMQVLELWRYPVKSLRGERLQDAELRADGIPGDRSAQVHAPTGQVITARNHPALLGLSGTLGADGEPLVDGVSWSDPRSLNAVRAATWSGARLARTDGLDRFDQLPISLATDGAVAALGADHRRLRPNIVVGGVNGLAEREWAGRRLRIGAAVLEAVKLRARCVVTTFDPDTLKPDPSVLRRIVDDFDDRITLDCTVLQSGRVAVGDEVELLPALTPA